MPIIQKFTTFTFLIILLYLWKIDWLIFNLLVYKFISYKVPECRYVIKEDLWRFIGRRFIIGFSNPEYMFIRSSTHLHMSRYCVKAAKSRARRYSWRQFVIVSQPIRTTFSIWVQWIHNFNLSFQRRTREIVCYWLHLMYVEPIK